jgi:SpoVK/Ycf46/Vps4 family AAA+-type ATPase
VDHLSEVLKIIDGALKSNQSMAANYAGLLADKLEADGNRREARLIRERLSRVPAAMATLQSGTHGHPSQVQLPVDSDSRLSTVDLSRPSLDANQLLLPTAIESRLQGFIEGIRQHAKLLAANVSVPHRLILDGPPGTGKTQTVRWIASTLDRPLLTVRCDTLISSLLGQTSKNLRRVFDYAQEFPCVLFLDEFDAMATARGNERDVGELQRVVISLLQNIDALPDETALVAATNHAHLLDPATWRRFSVRVAMPLPDLQSRQKLWLHFLQGYLHEGLDLAGAAKRSEGMSGAAIEQVCLDTKRSAVLQGKTTVDEMELFRRLGLTVAINQGHALGHTEDEVRWLRDWYPKYFSHRVLSALYETSQRQVRNALRGDKHGDEGEIQGQ